METLKLVIATNTAEFFLSHRLHLAESAKAKGYSVTLVAPPSPLQSEIEAKGFKFCALDISRKGTNPLNEIKVIQGYQKIFDEEKPSVFHGFTIKPVIYGLLATYCSEVPKKIVTI